MSNLCQGIIFSDKAYNAIIDETFKMHPNETGGILLGHILDNGYWIVMEVIPPGWKSVFQRAYFEYDQQFVNYLAKSISTQYDQSLVVLGLWHRHPGSMDTFSSTDDGTNHSFAQLRTQGAISGLVNVDPDFRLTMYHVTAANGPRYERVSVNVGDDIIPEDYFQLRHYPIHGENPSLTQKKNEASTVPQSKKSSNNTEHFDSTNNDIAALKQILSKYMPALVTAILLIAVGCACFHIGRNKEYNDKDVVSLNKYKSVCNQRDTYKTKMDRYKKLFEDSERQLKDTVHYFKIQLKESK